jgi:hypothetical protein
MNTLKNEEMMIANARLIAAAPELLAALQSCREAMAHHGIPSGDPSWGESEAAIGKATGTV